MPGNERSPNPESQRSAGRRVCEFAPSRPRRRRDCSRARRRGSRRARAARARCRAAAKHSVLCRATHSASAPIAPSKFPATQSAFANRLATESQGEPLVRSISTFTCRDKRMSPVNRSRWSASRGGRIAAIPAIAAPATARHAPAIRATRRRGTPSPTARSTAGSTRAARGNRSRFATDCCRRASSTGIHSMSTYCQP